MTGRCDWCGSPHVCREQACIGTARHRCSICVWSITTPWPAVFVADALALRRLTGLWWTVDAIKWRCDASSSWTKHPSIAEIKMILWSGQARSEPRDHLWPSKRSAYHELKRLGVRLRRRRSERLWRRELDLTPVSCEDDKP